MNVRTLSSAPAVRLAATELSRCLSAMDPAAELELTLGLYADLKRAAPAVADPALDDAFSAELSGGRLTLAGINPRAVLIGAYRVLHELGCRWLFPGAEGEILPARPLRKRRLKLDEVASFRHRTVCIEGATSVTNVLDMIAWLPKVGFNGFYMQFREGYQFFERWYSHEGDLARARKEPIERTMAEEFAKLAERSIAERNLMYHTVGHGWHCEAFGVAGIGWMDMHNLPKAFTDKVAVVDGQRQVIWAKPMLTSLCFSDPEVQQAMAREIADYADANPQVDYVHVWLDDGGNNMCECARCRTQRPTDWYIVVLNAIDAELTRRKNNKKVVFLAYNDLLWTPEHESFKNPARFVFMYANGRGKNYTQPLARTTTKPPEFKLNRLGKDNNSLPNIAAFLQDWKSKFSGDSFIFEYYGGAETLQLARVVYDDIQALPSFELNGIVNCQALRVFFPTGVGMQIMGRTLWNSQLPFDEQVRDYFATAFGKHADACLKFVRSTEEAAALGKARKAAGAPAADPEKNKAVEQLRSALEAFAPTLAAGKAAAENPARVSWRMLEVYTGVLNRVIHYVAAGGNEDHLAFHGLRLDLCAVEDELQPWMEMGNTLHRFLR